MVIVSTTVMSQLLLFDFSQFDQSQKYTFKMVYIHQFI